LAVSPDGSLIAVGAERVLFFSRDGTLLGKEPYGTSVLMSADGKYTASVYFATLYFFKNPVPVRPADQQIRVKLWERELTEQVHSLDMSRDGSLIVGQTIKRGIFVINTRTSAVEGNNDRIISLIKISPDGSRIIGISQSEIQSYTLSGRLTHTADLITFSAPHTVLLPVNGTFVVFNDGQMIRCVHSYNATELWRGQVTGYVTTLSMTPDGSAVIAGTDNGNIEKLDGRGNNVWKYASNQDNRQDATVTCTAVSDNGSLIAAGTQDGKILFLNAKGELTGSHLVKEYIRHIAVSADGSTVVAATDTMLYAFAYGSQPVTTPISPFQTTPVVQSSLTTVHTPVPLFPPLPEGTSLGTPAKIPTTYSVNRTATQSSASCIPLAGSLLLFVVLIRKR
jgi:WD40 repeat protein